MCAREEKKESKMPSALRRPRHRGLYTPRLVHTEAYLSAPYTFTYAHTACHVSQSGMEIEDGISSAEAELTTASHLDDITTPSQLDATSRAEARQRA